MGAIDILNELQEIGVLGHQRVGLAVVPPLVEEDEFLPSEDIEIEEEGGEVIAASPESSQVDFRTGKMVELCDRAIRVLDFESRTNSEMRKIFADMRLLWSGAVTSTEESEESTEDEESAPMDSEDDSESDKENSDG